MRPDRRTISLRFLLILLLSLLVLPGSLHAFPSARRGTVMAYSSEMGRTILFGGVSPTDSSGKRYEYDDTWVWTGVRWVRIYPETSPSARAAMGVAYDSIRGRILIFGGATSDGPLDETWMFKSGNWSLVEASLRPPSRITPAMTFDPIRDRAIIFGGSASEGTVFDTWEFDGTTWTLIEADGPKVVNPSIVYDEARGETLLIGQNFENKPEMYRFAGSGWDLVEPENLPPCAGQGRMVYQQHDQRVVFHGGRCNDGQLNNGTYLWDGEDWTLIEEPGTSPGYRSVYAMTYDPARRETLLYGGVFISSEDQSTYRLRDGKWIFVTPGQFDPGPRSQAVFAADPAGGYSWFYAGIDQTSFRADVWRFGNNKWVRQRGVVTPAACSYPLGAWDPDRGRLVVICDSMSVFEFDGETFTAVTTTGKDTPTGRRWASFVYDPVNKQMILFGGWDGFSYRNEVWFLKGNAWTKGKNDGEKPDGRILSATFWDSERNALVVFGGLGRPRDRALVRRYNDIHTYDGSRWTLVAAEATPNPRYGMQLGYDPSSNSMIMFGGKDENETYLNETWSWTGSDWTKIETPNTPSPRMNGRMVVDPTTGMLTLYGGYAGVYFSEIWTYADGTWTLHPEKLGRSRPTFGDPGGD